MNEDEAVRDFLGDRPGTDQLREWRSTLEHRLQALLRERAQSGSNGPSLDAKINELQRQVNALHEEEAVTQFVEDSVRATLAMGAVTDAMDEFEG